MQVMDEQKIKNMSKNFMNQIDRLIEKTNHVSNATRYRYRESYERFSLFLVERFPMQKIENVKSDFAAYASHICKSYD